MNKIAIFVSGNGEAAERIIKLFHEGNRVETRLVFIDDSAIDLTPKIQDKDVEIIHVPDSEWLEKAADVAKKLKENGVRLIVLDGFNEVLPDEILETTQGEMIRVSSPEMAPREVVAALEAELHKPSEEIIEEKSIEDKVPTPESEWADALKIRFTPPKIPQTPPEIETSSHDGFVEKTKPPYTYNPSPEYREERRPGMPSEPMPSTWLIWSILVTIFCCFIPGIIAIIFSSQVSSKYYAGDIEGAKRSSRQAEIWIIVSVVLGVLAATLYLPFMIAGW